MNTIQKFNRYCATLALLNKEEWSIPIPVKLAELRESPLLMEDVWISATLSNKHPCWLVEPKVWEGIHALLKTDRCLEEQKRLGVEANNLCQWFGWELLALEAAIAFPSNSSIQIPLMQQRDHLLCLKDLWSNPLASAACFDAHVERASSLAGRSKPIVVPNLQWIPALTPSQQTTLVLFSENKGDKMEDLLSSSLQQTLEPPERDHQDTVYHGPEGKDNIILVDFILDSDAGNGGEDTTGVVPVALFWVLP
ncbi:hypothetical protein C0991_012193, partial [Blastosporella zonata]